MAAAPSDMLHVTRREKRGAATLETLAKRARLFIPGPRLLVRRCSAGWRILLIAFSLCGIPINAATITTQLERESIMVGESTSLLISVEGGTPQSAQTFPALPGLSIQYTGSSQQFSSINGRTSSKQILNFTVTASQPGQLRIPAINIVVDGTPHPSQSVTLTVTPADATAAQNRYAFLRLNTSKQEVYVGEVFPVEVQLYVTDAENLQAPRLSSDGFIIHKQLDHTRSQSQVGNIPYNVLAFRMSVSAVKAGPLTLGPAEMNLVLRLRGQRDPNDPFGAFFGNFQRRATTLASPPVAINVLPLPTTNAPAEFTGAIGTFAWTISATPTTVNVGDPITLKIAITGAGNLDNLKLPQFNWPDFKTYQANGTISAQDALGIQGTKSFEQVIVPQSASLKNIPELTLPYFDPAQKKYVRLTHAAIPITVNPATGGQPQPTIVAAKGAAQEELPQDRTDIVHIKTEPGPMIALAPPLLQRPWFLLLQLVPILGLAGLTWWRKKQDHLANSPRLRRKIEVDKAERAGLHELKQLAHSKQSDRFFALVFRLLQERLGERLDLPASAITEAVLDDPLPRRGATPALQQRLHALFQICNQARFAPVRTDQELLALASELEAVLHELQRLPA
jgi:hypothetical protein